MKILFTGGSGLLGKHLVPALKVKHEVIAPSSKELDITKKVTPIQCDLVVHAAAYTNVNGAEDDKKKCMQVNIEGTLNLLKAYYKTPFVFISSEYAKNPVNFYSKTKEMGEILTEIYASRYLIIRTLFKPNPFPWQYAFNDQYTQGDYVEVIAGLICEEIDKWDHESKLIYVGTGRKTMYELAKMTRLDVLPISVEDSEVERPKDYL